MVNLHGTVRHLIAGAAAVAGIVPGGVIQASQADLAVDLRASDGVILTSIQYDVSVTNRGPQPLTAATVIVRVDSHTAFTAGKPCTFNAVADTVSCPFGAVAVNGTAKVTFWAYFGDGLPPGPVTATATRAASTPADPFAGNDSDAATCQYIPNNVPLDPPPEMYC